MADEEQQVAAKEAADKLAIVLPTLDLTGVTLEGFVTGVKLNDKGAAITFVTAPTPALIAALALLVAIQVTGEPVGISIERKQMQLGLEKPPDGEPEGDES